MSIYTVIIETSPDYQKPNFLAYIEDPKDTGWLKLIGWEENFLESKMPRIERVKKTELEEIFEEFGIVELDSLRELLREASEFENKASRASVNR